MLGETLRHLGWEGPGGRAAAGGAGEGPRAEAAAKPGGGPREPPRMVFLHGGAAGGPGRGEEGEQGAGEEEQVAPGRARPVRPSSPVPRGPCQWKGCAEGARRKPPTPGHHRPLVSGGDPGQLPSSGATWSAPLSAL